MEIWCAVLLRLKDDFASAYVTNKHFKEDQFDKYFRDSWLIAIEDGTAFLDSQRPQALQGGLQKFDRRLSDTFRSVAGFEVKFQLLAHTNSTTPRRESDNGPLQKLGSECA